MRKNLKNRVVAISFMLIITGFFLVNLITSDSEFTQSERRRLASLPAFTFSNLFSGRLFEEFEKYTLDQFVFRDTFRGIKAAVSTYLFRQMDNNEIYIIDGNISKMVYPLNEKAINNAADKINYIAEHFLKDNKVYYAVVPDKNFFLAEQNGYLSMDYELMLNILQQNIKDMTYIDLFDSLTIDDYYRTDIHWRQERLLGIADKILAALGNDARSSDDNYFKNELYPFYGSLYGQAALRADPDTLIYLTNSEIEGCTVYDYETKEYSKVYVPDRFHGIDPYDVYLSGAKSLLKVTNENAENNRELVLFRDSFGSSLAPLLMAGYADITLVDLRYISTDILGDYIDFSRGQDVLFLFNTQILNNSYLLK